MYNPQPFTKLDLQTIRVTYGIDRDFSENEILELSLLTYAFFRGGN